MASKKLTEKDISEIKRLLDNKVPQLEIAKRFGITQPDISRIKTGKEYQKYPNFYISGISKTTQKILQNIADNKDISLPTFMKIKIHEIIEATPEHLKKPQLDY